MSAKRYDDDAVPTGEAGATIGGQANLAAMQQIEESRAMARRAEQILNGEVEPPNEMAAYLVEQLRDAHAERRAVAQNIGQMEQRLSQLRRRQVELEGLVRKYIEDLDHWASKDVRASALTQPEQSIDPRA